jgi:hypothetical protein
MAHSADLSHCLHRVVDAENIAANYADYFKNYDS